jgi:predicted DNA-binding transcriptional regulator
MAIHEGLDLVGADLEVAMQQCEPSLVVSGLVRRGLVRRGLVRRGLVRRGLVDSGLVGSRLREGLAHTRLVRSHRPAGMAQGVSPLV